MAQPSPETELSNQPWFYPHASRADADNMLMQASESNSFLVRKSSKASCYALSMKHASKMADGTPRDDSTIEHALIQCSVQPGPPPCLAYTLEVEGEVRTFGSFADIIDALDLVPLAVSGSTETTSNAKAISTGTGGSPPRPVSSANPPSNDASGVAREGRATSSPVGPVGLVGAGSDTKAQQSQPSSGAGVPARPMSHNNLLLSSSSGSSPGAAMLGSPPKASNISRPSRSAQQQPQQQQQQQQQQGMDANGRPRLRTDSLGPIVASAGLSPVVSPALQPRTGKSSNPDAPLSPRSKQREKKKGGLRRIGRANKKDAATNGEDGDGGGVLQPIFGVPLDQLPANESTQCPDFVEKITRHLRKTALDVEGIFRHSGSTEEIGRLQKTFESGLMSIDLRDRDPHAVAGLLKKFLRELPSPIIPAALNERARAVFALGEQLKAGGGHQDAAIGNTIAGELHEILEAMPKASYLVLRSLSGLLRDVSQRSSVNMMTPDNLIICLVPTLKCIPGLILYSITHYEQVFDNARYLNHPDVPELREQSRQRAGSADAARSPGMDHVSPRLLRHRGSLSEVERHSDDGEASTGSVAGPLSTQHATPPSSPALRQSRGGGGGGGGDLQSSGSGESALAPAFFSAFAALNPLAAAVTAIHWSYQPSMSAATELGQRCQPPVSPSSDFGSDQFGPLNQAVVQFEEAAAAGPGPAADKLAARRRLLLRLAQSERQYAARLAQYVNRVLVPLSQYPAGFDMAASQVDVLFANIDQLYRWHRALSAELDQRLFGHSSGGGGGANRSSATSVLPAAIGDLLQHVAPSDLYQAYSNRYDASITMFKQFGAEGEGESQKLTEFLGRIKKQDASFNIDLCSYLLAPLQRLQTYADMLQALLQSTEAGHPELTACQRACQIMARTLDHVHGRPVR